MALGLLLFPALAASQARFHPVRDEITDEDRSAVSIRSSDYRGTLQGASIYIRCDGARQYDLFIDTSEFLNSDGSIRSLWRFDRADAMEVRGGSSTSGTAMFVRDGDLDQLVEEIEKAAAVIIRVYDYRGQSYTYRFGLGGSTAAISRLRCVARARDERREADEKARADSLAAVAAEREARLAAPWLAFPRSLNREVEVPAGLGADSLTRLLRARLDSLRYMTSEPAEGVEHSCLAAFRVVDPQVRESHVFVCSATSEGSVRMVAAGADTRAVSRLYQQFEAFILALLRPKPDVESG